MKQKKKNKPSESKLYGNATVGTKGQFVIPIEARKEFNIKSGDQLFVFGNSETDVLAIIKAENLSELIGDLTKLKV